MGNTNLRKSLWLYLYENKKMLIPHKYFLTIECFFTHFRKVELIAFPLFSRVPFFIRIIGSNRHNAAMLNGAGTEDIFRASFWSLPPMSSFRSRRCDSKVQIQQQNQEQVAGLFCRKRCFRFPHYLQRQLKKRTLRTPNFLRLIICVMMMY